MPRPLARPPVGVGGAPRLRPYDTRPGAHAHSGILGSFDGSPVLVRSPLLAGDPGIDAGDVGLHEGVHAPCDGPGTPPAPMLLLSCDSSDSSGVPDAKGCDAVCASSLASQSEPTSSVGACGVTFASSPASQFELLPWRLGCLGSITV